MHVTKRQRLRLFLLQEIERLKELQDDSDDEELLLTLNAAIDGLESLELGQVDEIFAAKTGSHGLRPATVKRYQAHAVGSVLTLKKRGYTIAEAEVKVASAFDIEPETLHKWRTKLKKTKDEGLLQILALYKTTVKFPVGPSIEPLLDEIKRKGEIYIQAVGPKSGKKGP